ncbi:MAG: phosphoribosylformylglycinamidine cyclo-ligase [Bdellovibrionales bacterium]|nr:phosphoribosylformylglycinamidine cyclo-ligase [Bdellovibrionales bacterium]
MGLDYKQAGVDIDQGEALVDWLKSTQPKKWPHQERLVGGIGGFSALFRADFQNMTEPCLVSCTDGVGTKVKLATHFGSYQGVGQDLVAMCVNDMICVGAQPLFFLDYYSTGKLEQEAARDFLEGVRQACLKSEMALIGGETAEMPDVYSAGEFDCAGFSVGVVDRPKALGAHRVSAGDALVWVSSSGFHSNGFSLIRKVFAEDLDQHKDELLKPTALYPELVSQLRASSVEISAIANITGGGMDNIPRVLPENLMAKLQPWSVPQPFLQVKTRAELDWPDLLRTLNCGVGLVLVLPESNTTQAIEVCRGQGYQAGVLGEVGLLEDSAPERVQQFRWSLDFESMQSQNAAAMEGLS